MRPIPFTVQFVGIFLIAVSFIHIFFGLGETASVYSPNPSLFYAVKWIRIAIFAAQFAVGFNILAGRNWARFTWLTFASLNLILLILIVASPLSLVGNLALFLLLAYCLFWDKNADGFFKPRARSVNGQ